MMDAAKDKRDMETKHSTIQQKVTINVHSLFLMLSFSYSDSVSLTDHLYSTTTIITLAKITIIKNSTGVSVGGCVCEWI